MTMNLDDLCDRLAIEYATKNRIKNIKQFDDLPAYHQAKVAMAVKKLRPEVFEREYKLPDSIKNYEAFC